MHKDVMTSIHTRQVETMCLNQRGHISESDVR